MAITLLVENAGRFDFSAPAPAVFTRDGDAVAYFYENVGVNIANAKEGYGYQYENVDISVPTPHIWYVFPTAGRQGSEVKIVGHGFGAPQSQYAGAEARMGTNPATDTVNSVVCPVISWQKIDATDVGSTREIDPIEDKATLEHQEIKAVVPGSLAAGDQEVAVRHDA